MKSLSKTLLHKFHFRKRVRQLKNYKWLRKLTILSLLWAVLTGSQNGYFLWVFALTVQLVSFLILKYTEKNFNYYFYIRNQERIVGDTIPFSYDLVNNSLLPITYVAIQLDVSKNLINDDGLEEMFFFRGNQMINRKHKVECIRRGHYEVGRMHARIRDPLGLFEVDKYFDRNIDLLVYPMVHPINNMEIIPFELFGSIRMYSPIYEDYTSIKEVRDYRIGDSFKHIHWKLSSKKNKLQTKEFELNAKQKIQLIINGELDSYSDGNNELLEESIITIAASIANYSLERGIETTLLSNNNKTTAGLISKGNSMAMMKNFLLDLTYFQADGVSKLEYYISNESRKWSKGTSVVTLTPGITHNLVQEFIRLKKRQIELVIILVSTTFNEEDDLIKYAKSEKIRTVLIDPNFLDEYWEVI